MFNNLFKKDSGPRKTGVYKFEDGKFIELEEKLGNGSINSIIEGLGYGLPQIHTVFTFDSKKIEVIAVKIFTRQVVFVMTKNDVVGLDISSLNQELAKVDWEYEYSSPAVEDILNEGIKSNSLTYDFLNSVVELKNEGNSIYYAPKLALYLTFKDNVLESFASSEWSNAASKWLKGINENMFLSILLEAKEYHNSELEAMEEVNIQCEALRSIPQAVNNQFIPLHKKLNGNINYYNLLATHYNNNVTIHEFKLVNKGRFILRSSNDLEAGGFLYQFGSTGELIKASKI